MERRLTGFGGFHPIRREFHLFSEKKRGTAIHMENTLSLGTAAGGSRILLRLCSCKMIKEETTRSIIILSVRADSHLLPLCYCSWGHMHQQNQGVWCWCRPAQWQPSCGPEEEFQQFHESDKAQIKCLTTVWCQWALTISLVTGSLFLSNEVTTSTMASWSFGNLNSSCKQK